MREVFLGQQIAHPNIVSAVMLEDGHQSRLYLAMPFYEGETLESRIERGPMSIDAVASIGAKIGRGVGALHRAGITHRDLKPSNIMLLADGQVKIIDLGVARLERLDDVAEAESPGTAEFMAPELFDSQRGDASTDQFALGVTLYRMLTCRYPYGQTLPGSRPIYNPAPPVTHYRPDTPSWLNAVVLQAISTRRAGRFADVQEMVFQLERGHALARPLQAPRPLLERKPLLFWQLLCGLLAILLAASIFGHLARFGH
jgi:serine/threonine protein kinase